MAIVSVREDGFTSISVGADTSRSDLIEFVSNQFPKMSDSHTLWDLSLYNFDSSSADSARLLVYEFELISSNPSSTKSSPTRKCAILVDSDLSFGMARMFQALADQRLNMEYGVFREKSEAIAWLTQGN